MHTQHLVPSKGLTLGSFVISLLGAHGADASGTPCSVPANAVGKITMINPQMTGEVSVTITYIDGISESRDLRDVLDIKCFVTGVLMPTCTERNQVPRGAAQERANALYVQAKTFARRYFCATDEIIVSDTIDPKSCIAEGENGPFCKAIGILVFVDYDVDADTPTLYSRGFDKMPAALQQGNCVTPWLESSQPGVGPSGSFGYWMGYTVDMRMAARLF